MKKNRHLTKFEKEKHTPEILSMENNELFSERDKKINWHPYTQHKTAPTFPAIVRGKDVLLWDENGKEYIDAIASWWANPYGHANPFIADAIYKQLNTLEHVLFGGFTHNKAVELSEKLLSILPDNQKRVFYSDNGSTAVEIAIKTALQFFYNQGKNRKKIIAFEDAFHGDTFGAMAASGISFFTDAFQGSLLQVDRIPVPTSSNEQDVLNLLEKMAKTQEYAGFIFEPLVLGAAGMKIYSATALDKLIAICKKYQIFTIADEVMTGFGRTGRTFACNFLVEKPDMMCLSKALTGGTIPMAITTFTEEIYAGFLSEDVNKALFHGHTFTANPTGCAAALASISLLESKTMQNNINRINEKHIAFQNYISQHPKVKTTRVLGVIFALEIKSASKNSYYGNLRNRLYDFFIANGIILRPVGNIVYILPPYVIEDEQLEKIYSVIEESLSLV